MDLDLGAVPTFLAVVDDGYFTGAAPGASARHGFTAVPGTVVSV